MSDAQQRGRRALLRALASFATLGLGGCRWSLDSPELARLVGRAEGLSRRIQRAIAGPNALAPEFSPADIAPVFRVNGTRDPSSALYQALARNDFRDWRLRVEGLVQQPLSLSLAELRGLPARTQITRHDCVEGWSCIGQWTGVPLAHVLARARPLANAAYVMFFCADPMDADPGSLYYESLDLEEARHPQTILAYALNGQPLPIANGAPIRLRAERQLGYKMAKYVMRVELVERFDHIAGGRGGYWEDQGYSWYAGI